MHEVALEGVEPFDLWPLPRVQQARSVDKKVAPVLKDILWVLVAPDGDDPVAGLSVPTGSDDLVAELEVLSQAVLVHDVLHVGLDLVGSRVAGGADEFAARRGIDVRD